MAGKRPKTELQLYRDRMRESALERREKMLERGEAVLERKRSLRRAALAEAQEAFDAREAARQAIERASRQESMTRLEYVDTSSVGQWSGLALGIGVAALIGVAGVLVYLFVRKKDGQVVGFSAPQGMPLGFAAPQPIIVTTGGGGVGISDGVGGALQSIARSLDRKPTLWGSSVMKTYRLPSLNDRTRPAIRVAQATDVPYEVVLRTVEPAGQFAAFSLSATELNTSSGTPLGDNIIIPAGDWQLMTLKPREVLYAKGSNAVVVVSVTANEYAGGR